ncbi:hypothetical protein QBC32DRAFT_334556 [Pseudoneurospora amorphoporcata]|uniref:Secreted peptide n=1 Tax=Pseudoneurospora amorphoporcata TaxID=241081 RepID=A0AAN6P212_9PEZI|nr:hypothetical protein QBC32DRAFT_334556 [Pseudoneurospora amorphoporcata]
MASLLLLVRAMLAWNHINPTQSFIPFSSFAMLSWCPSSRPNPSPLLWILCLCIVVIFRLALATRSFSHLHHDR